MLEKSILLISDNNLEGKDMLKAKLLAHKLYIHIRYFFRLCKKENMTSKEAWKILDSFYHQDPPEFQQKVNYNPEYDLMIIVPVYNTEAYLDECMRSLVKQETKYLYKIVVIDDGSTDCSGEILDNYSESPKVKIVHKENSGIAGARNTALREICGRYIMFVDSDDILPNNAVEMLMDAAVEKNADLVEGTYIEFNSAQSIESGLQAEQATGYPWGKVISAEKMFDLCFPVGYQYEDTIISTLLFPNCNVVCSIPDTVYYYRKNDTSVTATLYKKKEAIDTCYMTFYCFKESIKRGYKINLDDFLRQVRLNWLRTQRLPVEIQRAAFVLEIEIFSQLFDGNRLHKENTIQKLNEVLKKHSFCAYEYLMLNWQIWNA